MEMAAAPSPCPVCGLNMVETVNREINEQTLKCQCGHLETYKGGRWTYECTQCGLAETCHFRTTILGAFPERDQL